MNNKFTNAMTDYINYIVIGVISLAVVTFLPLIGSTAGLGFKVPDTIAGWIVWAVVRGYNVPCKRIYISLFYPTG